MVLQDRADESDMWNPRIVELEKLTAQLNSNYTDLRISNDQSIEGLVAGQFDVDRKVGDSK